MVEHDDPAILFVRSYSAYRNDNILPSIVLKISNRDCPANVRPGWEIRNRI